MKPTKQITAKEEDLSKAIRKGKKAHNSWGDVSLSKLFAAQL